MTGDPVPAIFEALASVMADVKAVGKHETNQAQGFSFRGVDAVVNAVGPVLREYRVLVVPMVEDLSMSTVEVGRNRTPMAHATVRVRYRFFATDGSSVDAVVVAESFDSGDKAVSKSLSVAFRTALIQTLALPTNEPDADSQSYERAPAVEQEPSRFDELRSATKALAHPEAVVEWLKESGIKRSTLTDDLADEWQTRIDLAGSLEPEPAP